MTRSIAALIDKYATHSQIRQTNMLTLRIKLEEYDGWYKKMVIHMIQNHLTVEYWCMYL
jgi:hypothetical protein